MNQLRLALVIAVLSLLAGCPTFPPQPVQDGCRMTLKSQGGWKIGEFTVPLGRLAPGEFIKIKGVEYGPDQAYALTQAAQRLEQVRLFGCGILASPALKYASQQAVDAALAAVTHTLNAIITFKDELASARTAQEGVNAANKARGSADDAEKQMPEPLRQIGGQLFDPAELQAEIRTVALTATAAHTAAKTLGPALAEVTKLVPDVASLKEQLSRLTMAPLVHRLEITGYAPSSHMIPAASREALTSRFREVIETFPIGRTPVVLIVGYADESGTHTTNVALGLKRAQRVGTLLQLQHPGSGFEWRMTSGGVVAGGKNARRVEVLVS